MQETLTLTATVYLINQLNVPEAPQVALAGRSNVGKSSLVNCLAGRKALAKVSSTPGKTRSLNFFQVNPGGYYLVDLPGYGYARCSKTERQKWADLVEAYLRDNPWLATVLILLDSRLPPQQNDLDLLHYLRNKGLEVYGVLTKADKCKQSELAARQAQWGSIIGAPKPPVIFSSKTGFGRDKLFKLLAEQAVRPDQA